MSHSQIVLVVYRPLSEELRQWEYSELQIVRQKVDVAGRPCAILSMPVRDYSVQVYVDREREYLPVRLTMTAASGVVLCEWLWKYTQHPQYGWIPKSGKRISLNGDGSLDSDTDIEFLRYDVNMPVDDSQFSMSFPPGTLVTDERTNTSYIQRDDGETRPILRHERGQPYSQLAATNPGEAFAENESLSWSKVLWLIGVLGMVSAAAILVWRVARRPTD